MAHTQSPDVPPNGPVDAEALAKGYEPHDIGLKPIFVFIVFLVITLVVVLAAIYGIMMILAEHDRGGDPIASPVIVRLPPVYAPLQPSLGFYGDGNNDHDLTDQEDMIAMRYRNQQTLNAPAGVTESGRGHMPISAAMEKALPLLVSTPAVKPGLPEFYPPGAREGYYPDPTKKIESVDPAVHKNSLDRLIVDN